MDVFEFTKQVLAQTDKGMAILDGKGIIRYANPLFYSATGIPAERLTSQPLFDFYSESNPGLLKIFTGLAPGDAWQGSLDFSSDADTDKGVNAVILRLEPESDRAVYLLTIDRVDDEGRRSGSGTVDDLTGLPKEEIFLDRVEQFLRFSRREKSFAIMFLIRLDRFNLMTDG
ncbi:MAG: PAS domain-containing protein, partial [Desulfobacterales bacterium]|nr:PAS domain-containing protein [Desulfobacterales bacterium]